MFFTARKLPRLKDKVAEMLEQLAKQSVLEHVRPVGITNASPVWEQKKSGEQTSRDLESAHINGKITVIKIIKLNLTERQ